MFVALIMIVVIFEIIFAGLLVATLSRSSNNIKKIDKELTKTKKLVIPILLEIRTSLRMINIQAKNIKTEQQSKQFIDIINILGIASLFFGIGKKKYCK